MSRFQRTTEFWPLFVTVVPSSFDVSDVDDYIATTNELYEREERFATLVVTSATATMPGSAERRRLADWQNETVAKIKTYNVFTATVIASPLIRGAMTAMNWIFRPPNDQVVTGTFDEAFGACITKLREDGAPFSPALVRLVDSRPTTIEELLAGGGSHRTGSPA